MSEKPKGAGRRGASTGGKPLEAFPFLGARTSRLGVLGHLGVLLVNVGLVSALGFYRVRAKRRTRRAG